MKYIIKANHNDQYKDKSTHDGGNFVDKHDSI